MKCHYEVLGVPRNALDDDIKKAYRKLALQWHPDKNLDNQEEAKEQFQIVQQAWEVLSDPHERAWYDNHREAILKGGIGEDYKDDSIDLFQYFSASCFKGYGDDKKGFYTVYRNVFEKLAAEDAEFAKEGDSDEEVPGFGDSQSSYEDVVHNFYAYWQSYSTKRSFAWLDPYDIRDAPNRRVLRLIEKDNKKVRDKAKRERNEQVRNLVAFVRKRDKRVQAHAQKLAERAQENLKKAQERKKQQLLERQRQLKSHTVSEWSQFSNIESELKNIEASLVAEFGEELSSDDDTENGEVDSNTLYCVACNKIFKTHKAFINHENSKKHKENITNLRAAMVEEDKEFNSSGESDDTNPENSFKTNEHTARGEKLATDSQMPDFLLNPVPNSMNVDNTEQEVGSEQEFLSGDDDSDLENQSMTKVQICVPQGGPFATSPGMDEDLLMPETSNTKNEDNVDTSEDELLSNQDDENMFLPTSLKKMKKKKNVRSAHISQENEEENANPDDDLWLSKKQRKKKQQKKIALEKISNTSKQQSNDTKDNQVQNDDEVITPDSKVEETSDGKSTKNNEIEEKNSNVPNGKVRGAKAKRAAKKQAVQENKDSDAAINDLEHCCVSCKVKFSSKNKLFEHLKKTGHSVYLPELSKHKKAQDRATKAKTKADKKN